MCEQLGQLREAMGRFAAGFDALLLSCDDAAVIVGDAAVIENLAATVKGLAAARFAAGEGWKAAGARSARCSVVFGGCVGGPAGAGNSGSPLARGAKRILLYPIQEQVSVCVSY